MPSSWLEFIVSMNVAVRWGEAERREYVPSSCRSSSVFLHRDRVMVTMTLLLLHNKY